MPPRISRALTRQGWALGVWARDAVAPILPARIERFLWATAQRVLPPPGDVLVVDLPGGGRLALPSGAQSAWTLASGRYERDTTALLRRLVGPGMGFVDVGANVGYYTVIASRLVGRDGHVWAFEPNTVAAEALRDNLLRNEADNVVTTEVAVSSHAGRAHLVEDGEWSYLAEAGTEVQATTLDHFFADRGWPRVDVVKIDVEGSELAVLAGMHALADRNPRMQLIIEYNAEALARGGRHWSDLAAELRRLGFSRRLSIGRERRMRPLEAGPPPAAVHNMLVRR